MPGNFLTGGPGTDKTASHLARRRRRTLGNGKGRSRSSAFRFVRRGRGNFFSGAAVFRNGSPGVTRRGWFRHHNLGLRLFYRSRSGRRGLLFYDDHLAAVGVFRSNFSRL
ncbi:hypothetical protein AGMMS49928_26860 [Spirochaetia bacterium]|nr:hypothetical protein AGMMS49928_26860 [Spirochaetia bacterium]